MKLILDLMDQISHGAQIDAVKLYMIKNGYLSGDSWGIVETKKDTGTRIELPDRRAFHVSCKQNKFESYSFKVWQEV